MIISRTPVRISLFGGGTDYPEYFVRNKGAVLGSTIDKYVYISLNELSNFFQYKIRVGYSKAELVETVDEIIHPSVRECLKFKGIKGNLDIHIFADLPARTGLGSSSSFTVGLLNALNALKGKTVSKHQLAEDAITVEQQMIKENVGCQDQMHAAYGGLNIIEFDTSGIKVRQVVMSKERLELLNTSLLGFFTHITRSAHEVLHEQIENTKSGSKDSSLEKMYRMVYQAEKLITDSSDDALLKDLGSLLQEGWYLKKTLSSRITNTVIDYAYEAAVSAGAYGGKLAGAGGGGFLFFLAPVERHDAIRRSLNGMLEVKFNLETEGSKIIYILQKERGLFGCDYLSRR